MPRVAINKQKYLLNDLADYITGEMKRKKITQTELANLTDMTQSSFSKHLKNCDFDIKEIVIIFHALGTEEERIGRLLKL